MVQTTDDADTHTPTGDSEHVAYGKDYYWTCTCGSFGMCLTTEDTARQQAAHHERHCTDSGTTTVRVSQ